MVKKIKLSDMEVECELVNTGCHYFRGQRIIIVWDNAVGEVYFIDISRSVDGVVKLPTGSTTMDVISAYVKSEYESPMNVPYNIRRELEEMYRGEEMDGEFEDISAQYKQRVMGGW